MHVFRGHRGRRNFTEKKREHTYRLQKAREKEKEKAREVASASEFQGGGGHALGREGVGDAKRTPKNFRFCYVDIVVPLI